MCSHLSEIYHRFGVGKALITIYNLEDTGECFFLNLIKLIYSYYLSTLRLCLKECNYNLKVCTELSYLLCSHTYYQVPKIVHNIYTKSLKSSHNFRLKPFNKIAVICFTKNFLGLNYLHQNSQNSCILVKKNLFFPTQGGCLVNIMLLFTLFVILVVVLEFLRKSISNFVSILSRVGAEK